MAHSMVDVKMSGKSSAPSLYNHDAWWRDLRTSEIPGVEAGTYEVELNTGGQWRIESAKCGGRIFLNDDLVVQAGFNLPPSRSRYEMTEPRLKNRDSHARTSGYANRVARSTTGSRSSLRKLLCRGQFSFRRASPGDYLLIGLVGSDKVEYVNPKFSIPIWRLLLASLCNRMQLRMSG